MKIGFICMQVKTHFNMKGYAPRLALKKMYKTTRKWPVHGRIKLDLNVALIKFVWIKFDDIATYKLGLRCEGAVYYNTPCGTKRFQ